MPSTSSRYGVRISRSCKSGCRALSIGSSVCPASWTLPPTASKAGCRRTSPSTARRRRVSGCACRTSTTRSTMHFRNGRSRQSTVHAINTVILEVDAAYQRDPTDLVHIYVPGSGNAQVPLSAVTKYERGIAPLLVNHQGQFPSVPITYNLAPNALIEDATRSIDQAVAEMHIPDIVRADFSGDVQAYRQAVGAQPLLLLAALVAVYIVLGVLYESLAHPLTIISTLPSAGLGALLALEISGTELSVIAF